MKKAKEQISTLNREKGELTKELEEIRASGEGTSRGEPSKPSAAQPSREELELRLQAVQADLVAEREKLKQQQQTKQQQQKKESKSAAPTETVTASVKPTPQ